MSPHKQEAQLCLKSGLKLMRDGKHDEAMDFFDKAISLNPEFADAYFYRGELFSLNGRIVEGNTDKEKAKALRSGKHLRKTKKKEKRVVNKINLKDTDSVYDLVFPEEENGAQEDTVNFDSDMYDYAFSDDSLESGMLLNGLPNRSPDSVTSPAIFEYLGGKREEVLKAQLFYPAPDEITIIQEHSGEEKRTVTLQELCCIRLAMLPSGYDQQIDPSSEIEIIETRDGNVYHEYISQEQPLDGIIAAFSTKETTSFPYTLFPEVNVRLRSQKRFLGDILLEKRFIAEDILKSSLEEHRQLRSLRLGRIISRQANLHYSAVETTLANADRGGLQGLKVGEVLLNSGLVDEDQVLDALEYQEKIQHKKLGRFLVEKGILGEKELYVSLAEKFSMPFVDLRQQKVSKKILAILPREMVLQFKILPIALKETTLVIATPTPDILEIKDALRQLDPGRKVEFVLAQPTHLRNIVNILYKNLRRTETEE